MASYRSFTRFAASDTYSKMPKFLRATAAWRISIWTTLAFALGTALAFSIVYFFVAKTIQERSDAWLSGEAEVLARVSSRYAARSPIQQNRWRSCRTCDSGVAGRPQCTWAKAEFRFLPGE